MRVVAKTEPPYAAAPPEIFSGVAEVAQYVHLVALRA
jgi:hypothetical protein